jgi:hypothetical protein
MPAKEQAMNNDTHSIIDFSALAVLIGTVTQVLPPIAAFLSILWLLVRIVESRAFRALVKSTTGYDINTWLGETK